MRLLIAALAAAFFFAPVLAALPAQAQRVPCGDGGSFIAYLEKKWGEDPAVIAIDAGGDLVRILANPGTGTWSVLITRPSGLTCLVQSGTAWEPIERPPDPGDPS